MLKNGKRGISLRKHLKTASIVTAVVGLLAIFVSCGSPSTAPAATSSTPAAAAQGDTTTGTRTITDMAGRKVVIPSVVKTVYCAVPTAEPMVFSLAPEKMAAWVNQPTDAAISLLGPRAKELPALGGWMGEKVTANLEQIAKVGTDVIIWLGDPATAPATADAITQQTGRPVVVLDSNFDPTPKSYAMLGDILGVQDRATKLIDYWNKSLSDVSAAVATVPDNKRVWVYYAEGTGGLSTDTPSSGHTVVLEFVRGVNVAVGIETKNGAASTPVSMEQVLSWNPELILVSSSGGGDAIYDAVTKDSAWSEIKAVKNKQVYMTPLLPFGWFDRPPSIMRAIGVPWCANLLYPEYYKIDIRQKTKEFFKLYFNKDLTEEQLNLVLKKTVR